MRNSRKASAASDGVRGEGLLPDRTGVAPARELAAVLAPSSAEATVLKAAPPKRMSLARVRPGARSSESFLTPPSRHPDRKSTRLNSSHANISYAVFCLKKKKAVIT